MYVFITIKFLYKVNIFNDKYIQKNAINLEVEKLDCVKNYFFLKKKIYLL